MRQNVLYILVEMRHVGPDRSSPTELGHLSGLAGGGPGHELPAGILGGTERAVISWVFKPFAWHHYSNTTSGINSFSN